MPRRVACRVSMRASKRWLDATSSSDNMNAARSSGVFIFSRRSKINFRNFFGLLSDNRAWLAIGRIAYDSALSECDDERALDIARRHRSKAQRAHQRNESREKSIDSRNEKYESRAEIVMSRVCAAEQVCLRVDASRRGVGRWIAGQGGDGGLPLRRQDKRGRESQPSAAATIPNAASVQGCSIDNHRRWYCAVFRPRVCGSLPVPCSANE